MLRFLVDESSGKKLQDKLLEKGFDSIFVSDIMPGASDPEVLKFAEKENRILITNDKDFGELIFRYERPSSGVILFRLRNDSPQNRQKHLFYLIKNLSAKMSSSFIVVKDRSIRVRSL